MTPSSMALFALASQCPGSSHIYAIVGYDDTQLYPYVVKIGGRLERPIRWDADLAERLGWPTVYHTYEAADEARKKASAEIWQQGRELFTEIDAYRKQVSQ